MGIYILAQTRPIYWGRLRERFTFRLNRNLFRKEPKIDGWDVEGAKGGDLSSDSQCGKHQ